MRKYDIVNGLARKRGYQSYLEICTPSSGMTFARVDRTQFPRCHRLLYRCPEGFTDGAEITYRAANEDISGLIASNARYDCVFLDPFHGYECSYRDLEIVLSLVSPHGVVVVHDCSPPTQDVCGPSPRQRRWCGCTYCAYIDFVFALPELSYYTVDTDFGCGVIQKAPAAQGTPVRKPDAVVDLSESWRAARNRDADMYSFFDQHRRDLLNLVSVRQFLAAEHVPRPWPSEFKELRHRVLSRLRRVASLAGH